MRRKIALAAPETGEEEWRALREPLFSGRLTQGPKVAEFERLFSERHKVAHAKAVSSATTGLHLALLALGVGPGDEVIVPSFTWVASANAVVYCGAVPILADIDSATFNLDPDDVARCVSPRTRAVIAVHLFGLCADIDAIRRVVPNHVRVVEDAACAAGATYKGRPAGGLADIAVFSFHPRKSITTGEGGMVTTREASLAARVESLRNHGATLSAASGPPLAPYVMADFNEPGFNYRMTELQAALGAVQLGKLDRILIDREAGAAKYDAGLTGIPWLRLPYRPNYARHTWQSYVISINQASAPLSRNDLMSALDAKGIETRPGTHAVHTLGYYRDKTGLSPRDLPRAHDAAESSIAIPLHSKMHDDDYAFVVDAIREHLS
jgi:dTDP-4-amino-4,6-dideoxygalactose transaminase